MKLIYTLTILMVMVGIIGTAKAEEEQFLLLCSCGEPVVLFSTAGAVVPIPGNDPPEALKKVFDDLCKGKQYKNFTAWDEQKMTGKACPISL